MQGRSVQAEIDQKISQAITEAVIVRLGGDKGQQQGFGRCLAVDARRNLSLAKIRSQLGNALAAVAGDRGLRAIGLIAYTEVSSN